MPFFPQLIQELEVLSHFDPGNHQQGIKIHQRADPAVQAATRRLHEKGLISQVDGGYLTRLGLEVVEHLQAALTILGSSDAARQAAEQAGSGA